MKTYNWYLQLAKPVWAPPQRFFGPVWTVLYIVIFISFGTVLSRYLVGRLDWTVALPFALNVLFNFAFTPIQSVLRNNLLACIDILLVVSTLMWALFAIWHASPELHWIAYVNVGYLLWGLYATCLQLTITYLNR